MKKLHKSKSDIISIEVIVSNFYGGVTKTKGVLLIELTVWKPYDANGILHGQLHLELQCSPWT